jgi:hypothetical protein
MSVDDKLDKNTELEPGMAVINKDGLRFFFFFFFYDTSNPLILRKWNGHAFESDPRKILGTLTLKLAESDEGTLEWVKAIVFQEWNGETVEESKALVKEMAEVAKIKTCLRGEEFQHGKPVVFGCSGDSPRAVVIPHDEAKGLDEDCTQPRPPRYHVLIPLYTAMSDGSLSPKEIWISEDPFRFSAGSAEQPSHHSRAIGL